jgi:hypothetical protein
MEVVSKYSLALIRTDIRERSLTPFDKPKNRHDGV